MFFPNLVLGPRPVPAAPLRTVEVDGQKLAEGVAWKNSRTRANDEVFTLGFAAGAPIINSSRPHRSRALRSEADLADFFRSTFGGFTVDHAAAEARHQAKKKLPAQPYRSPFGIN